MAILQDKNLEKLESQFNKNNLSVLHLVGSAVSDFYYKLSVLYAKQVIQPAGVTSYYAVTSPDGFWQLGSSVENLGDKISLSEMVTQLPKIDVVVPHMFCVPGMTSYRAFFEDILGIPVVGARSDCNSLATNKSHTKNIVAAAGVKVAKAQKLRQGDILDMQLPFIVKPNSEDNSMGVTLVREESEIALALETGFKYDETLLIEEYIPGRELRVGVIEKDGKLHVLPALEYLLTKDNPIRTLDDKLNTQSDGVSSKQPVNIASRVDMACPANISPELGQKLARTVINAHKALGYRDYSLYDFRIHQETQEPYMLESCSFWSFIEKSVLSRMLKADNLQLEDIALNLWSNAASRKPVACGSLFKYVVN